MIRNLTVAVLAVSAAGLSAEEQMPTKLVFGVISTESTVALKPSWEPFMADLSKAIGIPVEAFFASE